ncbi:MAG: hypothetical protein Kow00117_13690 [Phototrophicales bacterium]
MRLLNRDNPNAMVAAVALLMLAVFAGPNLLPTLISRTLPFADEGVPCSRLNTAEGRAYNQSIIGRSVNAESDPPIALELRTSRLPSTPDGTFTITIVVINRSIGPVPILVTPGQLILDPNQPLSGFGVVFNSATPIPLIGETQGYAESRIRILNPRQRCVHRVQLVFNQTPGLSALTAENATLKVYYRNPIPGVATPDGTRPPIYTDQGLWVGVVESDALTVREASSQ